MDAVEVFDILAKRKRELIAEGVGPAFEDRERLPRLNAAIKEISHIEELIFAQIKQAST